MRRRQCSEFGECDKYAAAKAADKPVFNIEYNRDAFLAACDVQATYGITTIFKVCVHVLGVRGD